MSETLMALSVAAEEAIFLLHLLFWLLGATLQAVQSQMQIPMAGTKLFGCSLVC